MADDVTQHDKTRILRYYSTPEMIVSQGERHDLV